MRLRPAVSVVLLAFVLLAVATMIVKDARRSQGARAISEELQQPSAAASHVGEPTTAPEETPVARPAKGTGTTATVPALPAPIATPHTPVRSGDPALPPATPPYRYGRRQKPLNRALMRGPTWRRSDYERP